MYRWLGTQVEVFIQKDEIYLIMRRSSGAKYRLVIIKSVSIWQSLTMVVTKSMSVIAWFG